ncbi:glycoside hydrolase family 70 protein [Niallia sp. 01092]|uniref:glycoside hydrolase family 70 protein n=1 Tax=unclassified Niallia TaxID=2837522 RepID=UPI003FD47494
MKKGIKIMTSAILLFSLAGCTVGGNNNASRKESNNRMTNVKNENTNIINVENGGKDRSPNKSTGFVSNADLDKHVIFQSFSLYQPYESNMYKIFQKNSAMLNKWKISDVWMPPAYRAFGQSYYGEGYAIMDRYDLGEFAQGQNGKKQTKYGTSGELKKLISGLHKKGIRVQEDLVPNQMMGLPKPEIASITAVDQYGNENNANVKDKLVELYSKGGGQGQAKYGVIKEWNHTYFNGTGPQQLGIYRVMVDENKKPYRYYGPNDKNNHLPSWLENTDAQKYGKINTIDNYLTVDGAFAVKGANTEKDQVWRSLLLYYVDRQEGSTKQNYLDYMRANGFSGNSDEEVRQKIIAGDSTAVTKLTDSYISAQPGYSAASDPQSIMRFNNGVNENVNKNVLQYEFLIGTDIDNTNQKVQQEQANWAKFLIDQYGFDGFRIDAASHYNTDILSGLHDLISNRFGKNLNNHLSYIESYTDNQVDFENSINNGQLVYDHKQWAAMRDSLGKASNPSPLSNIINSSFVDRTNQNAKKVPNWSFVNNHDQEHNILEKILVSEAEANGAKPHTLQHEAIQFKKYAKDREKTDKEYAPYNVPSQYAYILTNKDTVPTVFYGDMYKSDDPYMATKTVYYDLIVKLLGVRNQYVSGDQKITYFPSNTSSTPGNDLIASVRYGTNKNSGVATIIGNNPNTNATINVDMGKGHANQTFEDALSFNKDKLKTDKDGILTVTVKGIKNPLVNGYLAVYVPSKEAGKRVNRNKGNNGIVGKINKNIRDKYDRKINGHRWQQDEELRQWKRWIKRQD